MGKLHLVGLILIAINTLLNNHKPTRGYMCETKFVVRSCLYVCPSNWVISEGLTEGLASGGGD